MNEILACILYDHERRTRVACASLTGAILKVRQAWGRCLVLIRTGETFGETSICIYRDEEDMADEKSIGEIRYETIKG